MTLVRFTSDAWYLAIDASLTIGLPASKSLAALYVSVQLPAGWPCEPLGAGAPGRVRPVQRVTTSANSSSSKPCLGMER